MTELHPTRLYLIRLGGGVIPIDPPLAMSFGCCLVQMSDGRNVLIDTGLPPDWDTSERMPTITFDRDIVGALADLGLQPDDIDTLITTHFDPDLAEREQVALVVHGHDGAQWAALRTAPEFYD